MFSPELRSRSRDVVDADHDHVVTPRKHPQRADLPIEVPEQPDSPKRPAEPSVRAYGLIKWQLDKSDADVAVLHPEPMLRPLPTIVELDGEVVGDGDATGPPAAPA